MLTPRQRNSLLWAYRGAALPKELGESVQHQTAAYSRPLPAPVVANQQEEKRGELLANAIKTGGLKAEQLSPQDLKIVRNKLSDNDFKGGFLSDVGHTLGNLGEDIWEAGKGLAPGIWQAGKAVVHDATHPFTAFSGYGGKNTESEVVEKIAKPTIQSYRYTYGGVGAPEGSTLLGRLAAHPLQPLLDVATVASLGAGGSIRGAQAAARRGITGPGLDALVRAGRTSGRDPLTLNPGQQERAGVEFPTVNRRYSSRPLMKASQVGWDKIAEKVGPLQEFTTNRSVRRLQRQTHAQGLAAQAAAVRAAVTPLVGSRKDLSQAESMALDYALRGWNTTEKIEASRQMFKDSLAGNLPEGWNIGEFEGMFKTPEDARKFVQMKADLPDEIERLILYPTEGMINAAQATREAAEEGFGKLGLTEEEIAQRIGESQQVLDDYIDGRLGQGPREPGDEPPIDPTVDPNPDGPNRPVFGGGLGAIFNQLDDGTIEPLSDARKIFGEEDPNNVDHLDFTPESPTNVIERLSSEYPTPNDLIEEAAKPNPLSDDMGLVDNGEGGFGFADDLFTEAIRDILREHDPHEFGAHDDLADSFFQIGDWIAEEMDAGDGVYHGDWNDFKADVIRRADELIEKLGSIHDIPDDQRPIGEVDPELGAMLNDERDAWTGDESAPFAGARDAEELMDWQDIDPSQVDPADIELLQAAMDIGDEQAATDILLRLMDDQGVNTVIRMDGEDDNIVPFPKEFLDHVEGLKKDEDGLVPFPEEERMDVDNVDQLMDFWQNFDSAIDKPDGYYDPDGSIPEVPDNLEGLQGFWEDKGEGPPEPSVNIAEEGIPDIGQVDDPEIQAIGDRGDELYHQYGTDQNLGGIADWESVAEWEARTGNTFDPNNPPSLEELQGLPPNDPPNEPPPTDFEPPEPGPTYPIEPTYVPNLPAAGFGEQKPGYLARMMGAEVSVFTRGKRKGQPSVAGITAQNMFSQNPESHLRERPEILASGAARVDPKAFVESVARREKDLVAQAFSQDLLGKLSAKNEVGEPLKFENQEEVHKRLGENWVLVNEQFPISWFSAETNFAQSTVEALEQLRQAGKSDHSPEVEQILTNLADSHAQDFVRSAFNAQKLDGVAIPRDFFNYQKRLATATDPFDNKAGRIYARYMHRWRALTLAYMPRWALNTAIGSFALNMVKGVTPRDYRLAKQLKEQGVFGEPRVGGVELGTVTGMEYLEPGMLGHVERNTNIGITPMGERIVEGVQRIEDHFRRASFIHSLDKVTRRRMDEMGQVIQNLERRKLTFYDTRQPWNPKVDDEVLEQMLDNPDVVQDAIDDLNSFAYNFAALGPYERRYVRMAVPFWGWYKFISKVAYRLPVEYPGRTNILANIGFLGEGYEDQVLGKRPEWLHGVIPLDLQKGRLKYLSTMGQNPFGNFFNPLGPQGGIEGALSLGQGSPPVQALLSAFGLDTMRGGEVPISPEQGVAADYFGSLIDIENGRETNPAQQAGVRRLLMTLLRSAPQFRMGEQWLAGGRSVYPESIPFFDQRAMPTDPKDTSMLANLGAILGVAPKTYNLSGYQKGIKKRVKYAKSRNKTSRKQLKKSDKKAKN